jgi:hypothetical protein
MELQSDDVVLSMVETLRDPTSGRVRATSNLVPLPRVDRTGGGGGGGGGVNGHPDLLGQGPEGQVAVSYGGACGLRADTRVFAEDAAGRRIGEMRIGDTRRGFGEPAGGGGVETLLFSPEAFLPPSLNGGRISSPVAPATAQGIFTSFNNLGEPEVVENERGDVTITSLDDAGRLDSILEKLGGSMPSGTHGLCEAPSPIDGQNGGSDDDGDQTHYEYDRNRLREICAGLACNNRDPGGGGGGEGEDAGKSLRIEYPDTLPGSGGGGVEPICAGNSCIADPANDNNLPKRQVLPGSWLPACRHRCRATGLICGTIWRAS